MRKPCLTCPNLLEGSAPEFAANCESNHVIYHLTCKSCTNVTYVGKTKRVLSIRMNEHRKKKGCAMYDHKVKEILQINPLELILNDEYDYPALHTLKCLWGGRTEQRRDETAW